MIHPLLYEINTRCWLKQLSDRVGRRVTLHDVPEAEFKRWQKIGFTHIWLMGVWTTGPRARQLAREQPDLRKRYDEILHDWTDADVPGSPFAIADYRVPDALGGDNGLADFREKLHLHGLKLILDFVPNHLALDHSWTQTHSEWFVHASEKLEGTFEIETSNGRLWLAHGRDPYFPPWTDTAQLDYRCLETRQAMIQQFKTIADLCDGARCDMAILLLNGVFQKTWSAFPAAQPSPKEEFWSQAIASIRRTHPEFLFLAESYWNLEETLQSLGFDYTYDKVLTDLLLERKPAMAKQHLMSYQFPTLTRCARFLENHDEQRIAPQLDLAEHRAATLLFLALPGLRLIYDGQLTGSRIHAPVQLERLPDEPVDREIAAMYDELLSALRQTEIGKGIAALPKLEGWDDNTSAENIIAVLWRRESTVEQFDLAVINLSMDRSQGRVWLEIPNLENCDWSLRDLLNDDQYIRSGSDMKQNGLFLDLNPHAAQLFQFIRTRAPSVRP